MGGHWVYIMGIDGAGKTTVTTAIVERLTSRGIPARRFYARHFPFLILPFKLLARRMLVGRIDEFSEYDRYMSRKRRAVNGRHLLKWGYGLVWFADYTLMTWFRMLFLVGTRKRVFVDRFFLDQAVNVAASLGLEDDDFLRLARVWSRFFPRPGRLVFLDLPVETAFGRKSDIQSVSYLEERHRRYYLLSRVFEVEVIDADRSIEEVTKALERCLDL